MKFGVRECCDVVFRAKAPMKVGKKIFYKNEPVIYFDTLKTSTLEGAATTVYAQGGRGNARLMSWDGERTVTFTMEDALISPEGLAILTGAGLISAESGKPVIVHTTEKIEIGSQEAVVAVSDNELTIQKLVLSRKPSTHANAAVYAMILDGNDNMISEPFSSATVGENGKLSYDAVAPEGETAEAKDLRLRTYSASISIEGAAAGLTKLDGCKVLVDYYVDEESNAMEINITPDKFGGAFYIEASTLFREYPSQQDLPAEFIIPNGRVQSNFTFSMAGSGDPSTFTFTVDAFPDYTRFNLTEKVLASIQVVGGETGKELVRESTNSTHIERDGLIVDDDESTPPVETALYDGGDMDA